VKRHRPEFCHCCRRPYGGSTFCGPCAEERTRAMFAVRSVVRELWGEAGLRLLDATLRARRTGAARRRRERRSA
jgi:hypothetical protein